MVRYKTINMNPRLLPVVLEDQWVPGSFAHALHHLVDPSLDVSLQLRSLEPVLAINRLGERATKLHHLGPDSRIGSAAPNTCKHSTELSIEFSLADHTVDVKLAGLTNQVFERPCCKDCH